MEENGNHFKSAIHARRIRWAWITSVCLILYVLIAVGSAYLATHLILFASVPLVLKQWSLSAIAALSVPIIMATGQIQNRIICQGWDVWISDLGASEIAMLIALLERAYKKMTGLDAPRTVRIPPK